MAYQTIGTYTIYDWEQDYMRVKGEVVVKQELNPAANKSEFIAELWCHSTAYEGGNEFRVIPRMFQDTAASAGYTRINLGSLYCNKKGQTETDTGEKVVQVGTTVSQLLYIFKTDDLESIRKEGTGNLQNYYTYCYHNLDGVLSKICYYTATSLHDSYMDLSFNGNFHVRTIVTINGQQEAQSHQVSNFTVKPTPLNNDRSVKPITADNFNDTGNPSFTYKATTGASFVGVTQDYTSASIPDEIVSLQAALSFDGTIIDVSYRNIPIDGTVYTFNLTSEQRTILLQKAQGSTIVPIYYVIKVKRKVDPSPNAAIQSVTLISKTQKMFTVTDCNPSLNPIVRDIRPETLSLTNSENTIVRYESTADFSINAVTNKEATIVSQYAQCGSSRIANSNTGAFFGAESGTFEFNVIDSRGLQAHATTSKTLIEYVKPTCNQKVKITLSGETSSQVQLNISGNYFNGSFGAVDNTLTLQFRYAEKEQQYGDWVTVSSTPTFKDNTYEVTIVLSNFDYAKTYKFQSRAIDKLNTVISADYVTRLLPIFDWSKEDFNFNVPVNIENNNLKMLGDNVLQHQTDTILAANSSNIYLRPQGVDNTTGEMILRNNGNLEVNGTLIFNNNTLSDFIVETGSETMGSNGTWYWRKWASGKAECYGCRDFGRVNIGTVWGTYLRRSEAFSQNLPTNLFNTIPDIVDIQLVSSTYGGWISKYESGAPSKVSTGNFVVVHPVGATNSTTNISFYIVGKWK